MPPLTKSEPVKIEPLFGEITTNPSAGETEAVTLPLCIRVEATTSSANADNGISNN